VLYTQETSHSIGRYQYLPLLSHNRNYAAARTKLEKARTLRARQAPRPLVRAAMLDALDRAERCRRAHLVAMIEQELQAVDATAYYEHVYSRVRGRGVRETTISLGHGQREEVTVLFLDLQGSTDFAAAATRKW
jgi:class 3 adenylate cyclase